jgi:ribosome biogenesis GTPase
VVYEHSGGGKGLIITRQPRTNRFARWNRKRECWQIIAANLDMVLAVVSAGSPPFRPRFADRVLIAAGQGNVPASVLVNKADQGVEPWVLERIDVWRNLGIRVFLCSAVSGEGIEELKSALSNRTAVLFGPSGVGKSTLINRLVPGADLTTGEISRKHDRGRHVTNFGRLLDCEGSGRLVDTPGVREIMVYGIKPDELSDWFPEFRGGEGECSYQPCSHRHEPECGIRSAVEAGRIHPDRYENYLRIRDELEDESSW